MNQTNIHEVSLARKLVHENVTIKAEISGADPPFSMEHRIAPLEGKGRGRGGRAPDAVKSAAKINGIFFASL